MALSFFWLPAGTEQVVQIGFSPPGTGSFQGRMVVDADQGRAQGAQIGAGGDISSFTDTWEIRMHRPLILCLPWIAVVP